MSTLQQLLALVMVCLCASSTLTQAQNHPKTVVVNINYVNSEISVDPPVSRSAIGDTVEFRTDSGGELILRFVNPFSDDGMVIRSSGGVLRLLSKNQGSYLFRCSIQYPDGRIVGYEAGDHDGYGGAHNVGH